MDITKRKDLINKVIIEAGGILLKDFHAQNFKFIDQSSTHDIKIDTDKKSESFIIDQIQKSFPQDGINSEESGKDDKESEFVWHIDPMDGTNNFAIGMPYFGICVALEHSKEIVMSHIYNPISKQLFEATKGKGAKLNDKILENTSLVKPLNKSILSFIRGHQTFESSQLHDGAEKIHRNILFKFKRVLTTWAPALDWALLAKGDIDILISYYDEEFEQFAGSLIAREAGVTVVDFDNKPYTDRSKAVIAGKSETITKLVNLLK